MFSDDFHFKRATDFNPLRCEVMVFHK